MATKFVYKMENILSVKYKMEDQAKTAYGLARMKLTEEEDKLFALKNKSILYQEHKKNLMLSRLKLLEIRKCEEAIEVTKHLIEQQQNAVKKAEKQLENMRVRLNAAMLDRKTHEKLKENALTNFFIEYESDQRKEIDELISFKYNNPTDY
ncbi:flagellar export protein FliJ [Anaerocolumna sp. MB42-C2]|uniref:flagellar export protein FliJ n=1 Tax=Anaerocolumna sp. MB42-C2 TaxID=3070997 RepID=UPI0027E06E74|nr:flagellar export protein FliJ [Anaerocolumna sp. MB42-C2]WMJ88448.1 flagellar export protein FliJ [Anaerocolumna sp. MB42-C2]